ncbi:MAG: hypothetical protein H6R28_268 [Methanomicrobiales archaeon]|nr:hypothetical protein [Methanomicrobiales archaeon]
MVLASLREALGLLVSRPVLWITGLAMGSLGVPLLLFGYEGGAFLAGRLAILQLAILPFFVAGSLGVIHGGEGSPGAFLSCGRRFYFRVLLPMAVVLAAAVLTIFLVMIPVSLLSGGAAAAAGFVIPGVLIPFAFFTYFSDTAAVLEDRKALNAVRRSVEFTIQHSLKVVLFYVVNLAILFGALFLGAALWSILLAEELTPLTRMNSTEIAALTPGDLATLIGTDGIWVSAAVAFVLLTCCGTLVVAYRACFFRKIAGALPTAPPQGEYDTKGRWYRY